jgi:glycerate dehydrogenase
MQTSQSVMAKAVFLDYGSVSFSGDLRDDALYAALPGLTIFSESADSEVDARLAGCQVALSNAVRYSRERLQRHPTLKLIAVTATGTNNIDLDAARELGIAVCNIRDYCTPSIVQHVFAGLLALTHHIREYDGAVKAGQWESVPTLKGLTPIRELTGLRFGIIGFGVLGQAVARMAQAFGMHVLVAGRIGDAHVAPGRVDFAQLLPQVDVLSLHCPITPRTRHLINRESLRLLKSDAVLINTARGDLVDAQALAEALCAGQLGGAFIDVLAEEPPTVDNALLAATIPNLILSPHMGWAAREARQRAVDELARNVESFMCGDIRNRVV